MRDDEVCRRQPAAAFWPRYYRRDALLQDSKLEGFSFKDKHIIHAASYF